jgi:hypothetical protein
VRCITALVLLARSLRFASFCSLKAALLSGVIPKTTTLLTLGFLLPLALLAQTPSAALVSDVSNATNKGASPPPLPSGKSPVDLFRELLAQNPSERGQFLQNRTPVSQKLILAKLREYESLSLKERELRLQVTEMHWYLVPLMKTPTANRRDMLGTTPERLRSVLEARLGQWDKLPQAVQQQVLENEDILRYYVEQAAKAETKPPEPPMAILPAQRERLEKAIRQWQALSEDQRQNIRSGFDQVLELTPQEKEKIFRTFSDPERRQIELTLRSFGNLTPPQRSECLRSFEKLAGLSAEEREEFLKSAKHWELMTPSERQSWKNLVYKLSRLPPVPPGLGFPPVPSALLRSMNAGSPSTAANQPN